MKFSGIALVAMLAQFFLGKIAFLAGASFLLSKLALLFSIFVSDVHLTSGGVVFEYYSDCLFVSQNALKKQTSSSSGSEHVVYERDPGHSASWQRSIIPEMPEKWIPN